MSKKNLLDGKPKVQLSLDLQTMADALPTAEIAVRAGVDWLEVGTPLILGEGLHAVAQLHKKYPNHPLIADLKTMDAGYLEAEMMYRNGASFVVVMGQAHEHTIREAVRRGEGVRPLRDGRHHALPGQDRDGEKDGADGRRRHHPPYGPRRAPLEKGKSPLDELKQIRDAVKIPLQAVGGLSIDQAAQCAKLAPSWSSSARPSRWPTMNSNLERIRTSCSRPSATS